MKDWIKIRLNESISEMSPKPIFGQGAFHQLFSMKKYPDRLFKIGDEISVDEWLPTFKENPKYFPKIYRVFPYRKDPTLVVVEIEKLDTKSASLEFFKIQEFLDDNLDKLSFNGSFIHNLNFFEEGYFEKVVYLAQMMNRSDLLPLLYKWTKFLRITSKIVKRDLGRDFDLHTGNVAYDSHGNPKLIDI